MPHGFDLRKQCMKRIAALLVLFSFTAFQLGGCASVQPTFSSKADMGIFSGGLSGVIVGALAGNVFGALLGGMLGVAIGEFAGEHYDKKLETREEALMKYKLKDHEAKLQVEESLIDPKSAAVGSTVKTSVRYTVIAPPDIREIKITETRMLLNEKTGLIKLDERQVIRTQGTYSSVFKFTVPEKIFKGDSAVITTISNDKQTETVKSQLKIV
jgi:outer membrane lipoprotein SlyB